MPTTPTATLIYPDLIRDSYVDEQFNAAQELISARYDRSFFVGGITGVAADQLLVFAKDYIMANYVPLNSAHPKNALALARYYRAIPLEATDAAEVIVTYLFNMNFTPSICVIEMDNGVVQRERDWEWDSGFTKKQPISIQYWPDWEYGKAKPTTQPKKCSNYFITSAFEPVSTLTIRKSINPMLTTTLETNRDSYVGRINSTTFRNCAAGTVMCMGIATQAQPYNGQFIATLKFGIDAINGWKPWAAITSTNSGPPTNQWRDDGSGNGPNGMVQANAYKEADFNALLTLLSIPSDVSNSNAPVVWGPITWP